VHLTSEEEKPDRKAAEISYDCRISRRKLNAIQAGDILKMGACGLLPTACCESATDPSCDCGSRTHPTSRATNRNHRSSSPLPCPNRLVIHYLHPRSPASKNYLPNRCLPKSTCQLYRKSEFHSWGRPLRRPGEPCVLTQVLAGCWKNLAGRPGNRKSPALRP
jgi:hypothetical protein